MTPSTFLLSFYSYIILHFYYYTFLLFLLSLPLQTGLFLASTHVEACLPAGLVHPHLQAGQLCEVLELPPLPHLGNSLSGPVAQSQSQWLSN